MRNVGQKRKTLSTFEIIVLIINVIYINKYYLKNDYKPKLKQNLSILAFACEVRIKRLS